MVKTARSSKHLDSDKRETKAAGERKHGAGHNSLMDGIVGGIARRVSPPVIDGIVRGCERNVNPPLVGGQMSAVTPGATKQSKGSFGSGAFPEGQR